MIDEDIKDFFFGSDGFGNQQLKYIKSLKEKIDFGLLKDQHASKFIIESAKQYKR